LKIKFLFSIFFFFLF
jgi:hypothetical protein